MKLIVGLGNPGKKYENTRHNLGFKVLAAFGPYRHDKNSNALISKIGESIFILPQTFMNESGRAVQAVANFYKIDRNEIWVFHDEIDLPLGTIRISFGSSSAGHKGVESIINSINAKDFYRIRMGIMSESKGMIPTEDFVLQNFLPDENTIVEKMIKKAQKVIPYALENGMDLAIKELEKLST
jgi:PTH1 family peptidyl-tRNA hydrolase